MLTHLFKLPEKKTTVSKEVVAGITTFLAMAYIVFVNANILAVTGMDKTALIAVTCLVSAVACILTGWLTNAPIAMAPGMGLNAFFAYSLVLGQGVSWQTALGIVFLSGLFFFILTFFGVRQKIAEAIPPSLIAAMSVGIGLFITFIGLVNLGVVVANEATLVSAGPLSASTWIGFAGFLVMLVMEVKRKKGAFIVGIATATILAVLADKVALPKQWISFQWDVTPVFFKLDITGALKWSLAGPMFALFFMDFFDSLGSLVACCHQAEMTDEKGQIKGLGRLLRVDALATMLGALAGTSTTTTYVESAAGIAEGGRSGLTAMVTGFCFILSLFFIPLIEIVPVYATAPALILVGFFMMKSIRKIDFTVLEEGFPAFVIMVMIALSYSISTGLAFGFISYVLIKVILLKFADIKPAMWVIALLSALHFVV